MDCQICQRRIHFNELVMFGRPDGIVEPKDMPFVLATQAHFMINCVITCTYHPPTEVEAFLKKRHIAIFGPEAMGVARRGKVPCTFYQQGRCRKSDMCTFSHATDKQQSPPICWFWQNDTCRFASQCRYLHDMPAGANMTNQTNANRAKQPKAPSPTDITRAPGGGEVTTGSKEHARLEPTSPNEVTAGEKAKAAKEQYGKRESIDSGFGSGATSPTDSTAVTVIN